MQEQVFRGRDSSLPMQVPILAASLSLNTVALVMPVVILLVFDRVIPFQSVETLQMLTIFLLVSVTIELVLRWSRSTILNITSERAAVSNYRHFADRILHANPTEFSREAPSTHLDRFAAIAQLRDHHAGRNHALLIDLPFTLIFAAMIALIGGWMVLIPIAGLIATLVFSLVMKRAQWALFENRKSLDNRRYAFLSEVLSGCQTVKANRMERQMTRRFELLEDQTVDNSHQVIRFSGLAQNFGAVFGQVSVSAMGLLGAYLVIQEQIGIAEMAACMLLNGRIVQPLTKLMTLWVQSENAAICWKKLREIEALGTNPPVQADAIPTGEKLVLRDLVLERDEPNSGLVTMDTLTLYPGQIGLIHGGTRWQLQAFYDAVTGQLSPTSGEVLIDSTPSHLLMSWRGRDALVMLESKPAILSGTLLENLSAFGSEEQISLAKDLAAQLGLKKRIDRLPMGYNTVLGTGSVFEDDPVNRQLIALVRALALRPRILIMSEPTSVLDTAERDAFSKCLASLRSRPIILMDSPDPRMQRLADVNCRLAHLSGDGIADWDIDRHTRRTTFCQVPKGRGMSVVNTQDAGLLLKELLLVGDWQNDKGAIAEAFPHLSETLDAADLIQTLENLEVPHVHVTSLESDITDDECPALVVPAQGECYVALGRNGDTLNIAELHSRSSRRLKVQRTPCTVIRIEKYCYQPANRANRTVAGNFRTLRQMIPGLLLAAFLTNLLSLLAPLLIMAIYDRVIPSGSIDLLLALTAGVVILSVSDFVFRSIRTRALAYVGQKGERALAVALFNKLMRLPLSQLQKSSVNQQIARFRQFESLRELFTGQMVTTLIDLPFALLFLATVTFLAPSVGLLTLGLAALLLGIGFLAQPFQQRLDQAASEANRASAMAMQDAIEHQRTLANLGLQDQWLRRCMPLTEATEAATARARQLRNLVQALSQTLVTLGTAGAVILSAHGAVAGNMSFGALIASIALVSKLLAPVHAFQSSLGQLSGFRRSQKQADQVLALHEELELGVGRPHHKTLRGAISFQGVSYRPDPLNPALLTAAALNCAPGELVVIMGRDTANRTAVLDLVGGLVSPSAGVIEHDGIDIRQIARDELRKSVAYATYDPRLFHGTVKQNFRLAAPALEVEEMTAALDDIGIRDEIEALPEGYDTRLTVELMSNLSGELVKTLTLARCMARPSSVYLFSEPTNELSQTRRALFKTWLRNQQGEKTVLIATADRSLMQMADRLIYLNGDRVVVDDTGPAAIKKVQAVLKAMET